MTTATPLPSFLPAPPSAAAGSSSASTNAAGPAAGAPAANFAQALDAASPPRKATTRDGARPVPRHADGGGKETAPAGTALPPVGTVLPPVLVPPASAPVSQGAGNAPTAGSAASAAAAAVTPTPGIALATAAIALPTPSLAGATSVDEAAPGTLGAPGALVTSDGAKNVLAALEGLMNLAAPDDASQAASAAHAATPVAISPAPGAASAPRTVTAATTLGALAAPAQALDAVSGVATGSPPGSTAGTPPPAAVRAGDAVHARSGIAGAVVRGGPAGGEVVVNANPSADPAVATADGAGTAPAAATAASTVAVPAGSPTVAAASAAMTSGAVTASQSTSASQGKVAAAPQDDADGALDGASGEGAPAGSSAAPGAARATLARAANDTPVVTQAARHGDGGAHGGTEGGQAGFDPTGAAAGLGGPAAAQGTAAADPATAKINAPVGSPDFTQALADRVAYMARNDLNGARLQVNPPQLGPIELKVAVQGDHAQVWMSAHSAFTRAALADSAPQLRAMLGATGFGQVSVDVSQRSFQERPSPGRAYEAADAGQEAAAIAPVGAPAAAARRGSGALDAYA